MICKEIWDKYGDVPLKFKSYDNFVFTFEGVAENGMTIVAMYGGNADKISKFKFDVDTVKTLKDEDWLYVMVVRRDSSPYYIYMTL